MTYKTHAMMAMAISFSPVLMPKEFDFISKIPLDMFPFVFATIFVFSLAPDFDEPNSYLSKRFPWKIVSIIISSFTTHRGITHRFLATFFPPTLILSILYFSHHMEYWILAVFAYIAYFSHLIGDGFTKGGLKRFFYPFSKKTIWFLPKPLRFRTGSIIETLWLLFFTAVFALELYIFYIHTLKSHLELSV